MFYLVKHRMEYMNTIHDGSGCSKSYRKEEGDHTQEHAT